MKFLLAVLMALSSLLLSTFALSAQESDTPDINLCIDRYFYADSHVGWCVPEGWISWSSRSEGEDELAEMLQTAYESGLEGVYFFGNSELVAMQLRLAIPNGKPVYAQVFRFDYDDSLGAPVEYISKLSIGSSTGGSLPVSLATIGEEEYVGIAANRYADDTRRVWVFYPKPELGSTYVVILTAAYEAYGIESVMRELSYITTSLFEVPVVEEINPRPTIAA